MNRRGFLQRLAVVPLIPLAKKLEFVEKHLSLPTDSDLSFTSLQEAINIAERNNLGRPKVIIIPPELKWIARELLGSQCDCGLHDKPYTTCSEINCLNDFNLIYKVVYSELEYKKYHLGEKNGYCSASSWRVFFEHGSVGSVGP